MDVTQLASTDAAMVTLRQIENGSDNDAPFTVALNFDAGQISLYPGRRFNPLDLDAFHLEDGSSLADHRDEFVEMVAERMEIILNDIDGLSVAVTTDPEDADLVESTVYYTQNLSPDGTREIGRAHYDPCNALRGDTAVIFGEQIARLGDTCTLDEWVNVFANVSSHELCHTFGFGHIMRSEHPPTASAQFVELMLDGHTIEEMRRTQRMVIEQGNCPETSGLSPVTVSARTASPSTICSCDH